MPGTLLSPTPQVAIKRARVDKIGYDIDGSVTVGHAPGIPQTIRLSRVDAGVATLVDTITATPVAVTMGFAKWSFSARVPARAGPVLSEPPTRILAESASIGGANARIEVDAEVR